MTAAGSGVTGMMAAASGVTGAGGCFAAAFFARLMAFFRLSRAFMCFLSSMQPQIE
jgi:hypothetical protein